MAHWDAIVVGLGGIGSAACAALARRGVRVLGIDRWHPPHDRGSSHGATRIIRRAYFEHPDYVPLVDRAYELWHELEAETGRSLFTACGLIQIGPAAGAVLPGVLASVARHRLEAEHWSAAETANHFPQFALAEDWSAIWEPGAGFLAVEDGIAAQLEVATRGGADFRFGLRVESIDAPGASCGVVVRTDQGDFSAGRAIVAAGAWASGLLGLPGVSLRVLRKHLHWFAAPEMFAVDRGMPTFLVETRGGIYYGFPAIDERGLKVAEHSGGDRIEDPTNVAREIDETDLERVMQFVREVMPACGTQARGHAVCFYTMTDDEHFIVDRHPDCENTWIAAGFSGHGFKFAPVIGEALADLVTTGKTPLPIGFLGIKRLMS